MHAHLSPTERRAPSGPSDELARDPTAAPAASRRSRWPVLLALAGVLLLGLALRLPGFLNQPLWLDEANTWVTLKPINLSYLLRWQHHPEHPPLSYVLVRLSMNAFRTDAPWAMRAPSLACGVAAIAAMFWLGRVAGGDRVGLLAALLLAVSPCQVQLSGLARMYSLFLLLLTLALATQLVLARRRADEDGPWGWVALGVLYAGVLASSSLAWIAVPVMVAGGVAHVAAGLWEHGRHGAGRAKGLALALTVLVLATHVGIFVRLVSPRKAYVAGRPLARQVEGFAEAAAATLGDPPAAAAGVYALAVIGLIAVGGVPGRLLLGLGAASAVALIAFLDRFHSLAPRYLTVLEPALWVGVAAVPFVAAARWPRARPVAAVLVAAVVALLAWHSLHPGRWDRRADLYRIAPAMADLRARGAPPDAVANHPTFTRAVGLYYGLPGDPAVVRWLETVTPGRPVPAVPPGVAAKPLLHVVLADLWLPANVDTARDLVRTLAAAYGATVDDADLAEHVRLGHVATAELTRGHLRLTSAYPAPR